MTRPTTPRVAIVMPVFHPPADLFVRLESALEQVAIAVIIDDGSGSLVAEQAPDERVTIMALRENRGIAHALNRGVDEAKRRGAEIVLTVDQDSRIPPGYVARACEVLATGGMRTGFAVPDRVGGAPVIRVRGEVNGRPVAFDPIQSGAVIPVALFDELRGFAEELVIDAVDSDFTLRARERGREPVIVQDTELEHAVGEVTPISLFGRPLTIAGRRFHVHHHAPFRTYYMVRNSIYLVQRHGRGRTAWMLRRGYRIGSMMALSIVFGPRKGKQLMAMWNGLRDASRRVYGPIPPSLRRTFDL